MPDIEMNRNRRQFLGRLVGRAGNAVRPPWTDDAALHADCSGCGECVRACPEGILAKGPNGLPLVDFRAGSGLCTFCGECAASCPEAVFDAGRDPPWTVGAVIDDAACLARAGIYCRSCGDTCLDQAIGFTPLAGGIPIPEIDPSRCTGCGACMAGCPGEAISMSPDLGTRR